MKSNDIGKRIRAHRKLMGMRQEDLAKAAGTSPSFIGHIERGTRNASIETLSDIARVLGLSCAMLMNETPADVNGGADTENIPAEELREENLSFSWVEEDRKGMHQSRMLREIIALLEDVD